VANSGELIDTTAYLTL